MGKFIKALTETTADNLYGRRVRWSANEIKPIDDDQLAWFLAHPDVFEVVRDFDGNLVDTPWIVDQAATAKAIVAVAATFIDAVAADSVAVPGKTALTSGGNHGLTTGVTLAGVYIEVDWAADAGNPQQYAIVSVDSSKIITIDLASSLVGAYGLATVTPLNTSITVDTVTVPAASMGANGVLKAELQWSATNSANVKRVGVSLNTLAETRSITYKDEREVTALALNAAGTGYTAADVITLAGGTPETKARITVDTIKLVSAAVNAAGTGYTVGNTLTLVGGTHTTAATATVTHK